MMMMIYVYDYGNGDDDDDDDDDDNADDDDDDDGGGGGGDDADADGDDGCIADVYLLFAYYVAIVHFQLQRVCCHMLCFQLISAKTCAVMQIVLCPDNSLSRTLHHLQT